MIKKIKTFIQQNITIKDFLILFLIIQPIFDLKIFYGSLSTLIRVLSILLFFLYYFLKDTNNNKYYLLFYPVIISIYFIFHHINALNFHSVVPGNFNYSVINESLYMLKMACPFLLIYILYKTNFSKNELFFIIKTIVLFISLIIIASNLFLFSYGSYSDDIIKANFFTWFNPNSSYSYQDLASKGLFEFANQISAILLMFLPFILYINLDDKNKLNLLILFCNILALILLCTKVAVLGIGIVFLYFSFFKIFTTKNFKKLSFIPICIIFYLLLLPFNPTFSRISENKVVIETSSQIPYEITEDYTNDINTSSEELQNDTDYKKNYILDNYLKYQINENFILNRYPYIYDTDFWYDILTSDNPLKADYRFLEQSMVKRTIEINNNPLDKFLGITYTRVQNIFNIEKDFVMQYYSLGIIGLIIFISPYFIIVTYYTFLNKFKNMNLFKILSLITFCMILFVSYYSGNLLNSLSFTIYFVILVNNIYKNVDK